MLLVSTSTSLGDSSRFLACSLPLALWSHARWARREAIISSHHITTSQFDKICAFRDLCGVELLPLTLTKTSDETVHKK